MPALKLTAVKAIYGLPSEKIPRHFENVVLATPNEDIVLGCDADSDEIVVTFEPSQDRSGITLAEGEFKVAWTWLLTNQDGYTDGFRLELTSAEQSLVFDFVALASTIDVWKAERIPADQLPSPTRQISTVANQTEANETIPDRFR